MLRNQASHKIREGKWAMMSLWDNGHFPCRTVHPVEGLKSHKIYRYALKACGNQAKRVNSLIRYLEGEEAPLLFLEYCTKAHLALIMLTASR